MPTNQDRKQSRHQKILDAALDVFSERGYHEAGVDEIALLADTSKGGLYFHFPGKGAIFLALLDRSTQLLLARVAERLETEADPVARLDAALEAVVRAFSSHRSLARLLLIETMGAGPDFHGKLREIHDTFAGFISERLNEAVEQGVIPPMDTRLAGRAWFGAINEVMTEWVLSDRPGRLDDTYPALRALLLHSVGIQRAESIP